MKYINILSVCLYGLLGGLLSSVGLSAMNTPWEFFSVLGLVMLIDMNSAWTVMKTYDRE